MKEGKYIGLIKKASDNRSAGNQGLRRLTVCGATVVLACVLPLYAIASAEACANQSANHQQCLMPAASQTILIDLLATGQEPPTEPQKPSVAPAADAHQLAELRKTIKQLNEEVDRLRIKVAELEKDRAAETAHDRLTKEEQRAEALQAQLLGIAEKETPLQARLDQLTEQLRPENIANLPVAGSLHPDEVREATRRSLSNEKHRVQSQLDLLHQSRARLQTSLATADTALLRLRSRLH